MANLLQKASIVLTPTAYDNGKVLCAKPSEPPYGDFDFSRNSAATRVNAQGLVENVQILSSNLVQNGDFSEEGVEEVSNGSFSQEGVEEITNGDFSSDTNWVKASGTTISDGKLNITANSTNDRTFQNVGMVQGKIYKLVLNVSNYQSGSLFILFGGSNTPNIPNITSNGTYTFYQECIGTNGYFYFGGNLFNGSIDNVSVKEVGQDWTLNTGWSIGEDKAIATNVDNTFLIQNSILTSGKTYKITYTIQDYTSGAVRFRANLVNGTTNFGNGTYTDYIVSASTQFALQGLNTFNGSITNISVKEVGQNWNFTSGATLTDIGAKITHTPTAGSIAQASVLTIGNLYKLTYEITESISGSLKFNSAVDSAMVTTVGVHIKYFEADGTTAAIARTNATNNDVTITNISIIEITDDTNLPRINYEGFSYQDALGSEEIVNGDFSDGATGWELVGAANVSNGVGNFVGSGDKILQRPNLTQGKFYRITFDILNYTSGTSKVYLGSTGDASFTATANGTYSVILEAESTTDVVQWRSDSGSTFIGSIDNCSVKEYLGQEVVPDSGCGSWLFEPQTTQLLPYSEDYSQSSWSKGSDISIESGYLAPDGNNTAYKVTKTGEVTPYLSRNQSLITTTTRSIYARTVSGTGTATLLSHNSNTNNLFTLTEQWQRFELSNTASSPGLSTFYAADFRGSGTLTEYLVWGANATNDQDYATSYIPSNGSQVTRNQDVCTNGGSLASINSTEGTLYFEGSVLAENTGTFRSIALSDGTLNNRVVISYIDTTNMIRLIVFRNNGLQVIMDRTINATDTNKIAVKYEQNEVDFWINGIKVGTDTNAYMPIGLNELSFSRGDGDLNFFGKTKALAVWKEALSDQELADLTYPTPTDPTFALDFDTIATDFTFARGSEATYVDAQGLIQSTNEIGPELVTNGDFATDSDWNKVNATISSGTGNLDSTSGTSLLFQSALVVGKTYKAILDVTNYNGLGTCALIDSTGAIQFEITSNGNKEFYFTQGGSSANLSFRAINGGIFSIDNVSVKEVITATNTPRLDYSTGAEAFLLEPQSTNLVPYSEDFSQWLTISASATDNYATSPDGTTNASRFLTTNTGAYLYLSNISVSNSTVYTISVYAKSNGNNLDDFRIYTSLGDSSTLTATSQWQRFTYTFTTSVTSINVGFRPSGSQNADILIYGYQIEQQSYATSYIPTSGTTVTRNQETCINATPEINSEEGVLYFEGSALVDATTQRWISLGSGGNANRVSILFNAPSRISCSVRASSAAVYDTNFNIGNQTNHTKAAIRYKNNDFAFFVNGVKVNSQLSGTLSFNSPLSELAFDSADGGSKFSGNTKDLQVYTKALSDAELIKLTT